MGLPAMLLAQTLMSLAPTMENVRLLPADQAYAAPPLATRASLAIPDTARRRAIALSDGYYTRLDIHRYAGYAMLPLFLVEYVAGQKLLTQGSAAPLWAEKVHKPAAYAVAGVFTVNTVTGLLNLAEAGKIPEGRKRRLVHSALMLAADAGLIYGIAVAPSTAKIDARIASGKVGGWTPHKIATVSSMGVATIGYLMMYLTKPD
jgi:hypothetical protein